MNIRWTYYQFILTIGILILDCVILTHWGRMTHICGGKLTIIGSDNGLLPGRRQAIIWTNAVILLIGPLRTNFSENLIGIQTFSFKKMHLKMSSAKWCLYRLGLNELSPNCTLLWNWYIIISLWVLFTCEKFVCYWLNSDPVSPPPTYPPEN